MRIGIIGSGNVGRTLAVGWHGAGHEVAVGSRSPEALDAWSADTGVASRSLEDLAEFGQVIVLATAWDGAHNALQQAGADRLDGKTLIDATNPLRFTDRLELTVGFDDSAGEQVQRWIPGANVVKAFNTVGFELMVQPAVAGGPPTLFIAGDDAGAKATTTALAAELGWAVHDCGPLRAARYTEPMAMVWIEHAMRSGTRGHAFKLLGV